MSTDSFSKCLPFWQGCYRTSMSSRFAFPSWLSSKSILTMFSHSYVHNQKTPSQHSVDMPCLPERYSQHRVSVILCVSFLELLSSLLLLRFLFILTLNLQYWDALIVFSSVKRKLARGSPELLSSCILVKDLFLLSVRCQLVLPRCHLLITVVTHNSLLQSFQLTVLPGKWE